jgi:4-amino-4-deoxy-L-arabinose transferase-like glycosyltransferase
MDIGLSANGVVAEATAFAKARANAIAAFRAHRGLAGILAAGLLARLALLAACSTLPLKIVDEQHYVQLASSVAHGRGFAWVDGQLTSMRPPLYPLFIASLWTLSDSESLQLVRTAQIAISLATVALLYALVSRLFDRRSATLAAAIVCFYPSLLFSGVLLLTEVLMTFWLTLVAVEYFALVHRPSATLAAAIGATVGAAALTRSVLWPFPIVLGPLAFLSIDGSFRRRTTIALLIFAGYLAVVGPWAVRNTRLQRTVTVVDTMGGMNLRMGNYEYTPIDRIWDAVSLTGSQSWSYGLSAAHPEATLWTDGQKDRWAQREAMAYMRAHPGLTLERSALKFADFWGLERELLAGLQTGLYRPPTWAAIPMIVAVVLVYPLVALGAALGLFQTTPADRRTPVLIISLVVLITGIHTIVFGHSRYHLPLVPFLAMYAAAAVTRRSWKGLIGEPWSALAPLVSMALLVAIWAREIAFRDLDHVRRLLRLFT